MDQDLEHTSKYHRLSIALLVILGIIIVLAIAYFGYLAVVSPTI